MIRIRCFVLLPLTLLVLQGCAVPSCLKGSCSRPQSNVHEVVVWWPPHMRAEPGLAKTPPDHLVVPIE